MEKENVEKQDIGLDDKITTSIPPIEDMPKNSKNSRLYRAKESQVKRNVIITILGVLILTSILVTAGPQLLVQFSVLLDRAKNSNEEQLVREEEKAYIQPPTLEKNEKATKEPKISVSGKGEEKQIIELYINNSFIEKTSIKSGTDFTFDSINLKEGENIIKVRAIQGSTKSNFSDSIKVVYREKAPDVEIGNPHDGDSFTGEQNTLKVTGKTNPYAKVTVNGAWAIMDDEGNFQYTYTMQNGENKLMVVASDEADNKTEKEVKFNYSP